ncbi:MAG: phosphoribosylformylglycinamidine synthase subunit PurQ, partial [Phycisphaerae bacterium]
MSRPKVMVLRTAGTNCDQETVFAWQQAGAAPERVHVRELMDSPSLLDDYAILTIPGGFSYGDDIAAGKILAMQIVHHLAEPLRRFVEKGRLVLGICNGFQVLVKSGLLPGFASNGCAPLDPENPGTSRGGPDAAGAASRQAVTLAHNDSARFEGRWVHVKSSGRPNAFLPDERIMALPIAHGEGKLVSA